MRRTLFALIIVPLLGAPLLLSGQPADRGVAFVNVNVVPMDREHVLRDQTVIVRGDRIAEIGPAASVEVPDGATRVDAQGKYLIPGLAEMHGHIPPGDVPDEAVERVLSLFAATGVTTVRGMLGHPRHLQWRERAARGEILGPIIYTSGPSFNAKSAPDPETATRMVREQKKAGYDLLKIHPGVPLDAFTAMAQTAHEVGIPFAGHVPAAVGLRRALDLRMATIDHLDGYVEGMVPQEKGQVTGVAFGAPPPGEQGAQQLTSVWFGANLVDRVDRKRLPELVQATRKAGTWMVPTQALLEHLMSEDSPEQMAARPEMRYWPAEQVQKWTEHKRSFLASGQTTPESRRAFLQLRREIIKALHDGGVPFMLGADAPQIWNVPGFSAHQELQYLVDAGLTPYQALETGTRKVAEYYKTLDRQGTIEMGKRADLVLIDGNPLERMANTMRISGVVLGGRWLARSDLDERLKKLSTE